MNIEKLKKDIKTEAKHKSSVKLIVSQISKIDKYSQNEIIQALKKNFKGKRGRIDMYEWMKKTKPAKYESVGRPKDTLKIKRLKQKLKLQYKLALKKIK